jgi:hypothetical protein
MFDVNVELEKLLDQQRKERESQRPPCLFCAYTACLYFEYFTGLWREGSEVLMNKYIDKPTNKCEYAASGDICLIRFITMLSKYIKQ